MAGAGAIGQWLGARLHAAGHGATLLLRPPHAAALRAGGLSIEGHTEFRGRLPCVTAVEEAPGPFDAVFLTCKAHATAALGVAVAPLVAPDGVLVTLQNGLGNGEKLGRLLAPDRVAVALTSHGVMVESPGRLRHAGTGATHVGPTPGATRPDGARRILALLADAGLEPAWHDAMRGPVWQKAIANAGINPVAALHGVPNGALLDRAELRGMVAALVGEAAATARLAGVALPPGDPVAATLGVLERTRGNRNSMLQDVAARRPTEVEQIVGRMARLARRLGRPAPLLEETYRRVKALEASYLGPERAAALAAEEMAWEQEPA